MLSACAGKYCLSMLVMGRSVRFGSSEPEYWRVLSVRFSCPVLKDYPNNFRTNSEQFQISPPILITKNSNIPEFYSFPKLASRSMFTIITTADRLECLFMRKCICKLFHIDMFFE